MKTFEELCEAYNEFQEVVEKKCNEYCTIHKCENPFKESDTPVEIYCGTSISLHYTKNDRCGSYDCKILEIPYSFFETDEHSDEEQKALEKAKVIADIKNEINELQAQERIVKTQYDGMKKDINDIERLQKIYGIKSTAESAQLYSKFDSIRENMGEITHKLGLSYKKLRESYVQ